MSNTRIQSELATLLETAEFSHWAVYRQPGVSPRDNAGAVVRVLTSPGPAFGRGQRPARAQQPGFTKAANEIQVAQTGQYGLASQPKKGATFIIADQQDNGSIVETDKRWRVIANAEDLDGLWRMEVDR